MGSDAVFVINDTSALGRRARALLAGAGLAEPHGADVDGGARLLLVDAAMSELERALYAGAARVVHVEQVLPLPGDVVHESGASGTPQTSGVVRMRAQPYMESLLPRLALGLASGRFVSAAAAPKVAYVAHEDAAILAAALLASDVREPEALVVTGPSSFSHHELCAVVSELFSRRMLIDEVPLEQLGCELMRRGMSAEQAALSVRGDQLALHALRPAPSSDGPRVTGVAALSLPAFLDRARESLRAVARTRRVPVEFPSRSGNVVCAPINAP
jgi:hypothetical protein